MVKAKLVRSNKPGFPTGAIAVIVLGLVFLLDNLNIINRTWSIIWPSLIILVGLSMLYKHYW